MDFIASSIEKSSEWLWQDYTKNDLLNIELKLYEITISEYIERFVVKCEIG